MMICLCVLEAGVEEKLRTEVFCSACLTLLPAGHETLSSLCILN